MKVKKLELDKFSVFKRAEFEFSAGINVFIGVNGTGKSHLMKLLYSILHSARLDPKMENGNAAHSDVMKRLDAKLPGVFKPDGNAIGRIVSRKIGKSMASINLKGDDGSALRFRFTTESNLHLDENSLAVKERSIFIPSRETFAMYEGFAAAYEERELSFDETYYDLCRALSANPLKGKRLKIACELAEPFERDILHGRVQLIGGRLYVNSDAGAFEAHLLSEGHRKIASLVRLIVNGSLMRNGFLFWDEPEANLNPKLVTKIAAVLRRLAAAGIQVFIATHDYLLTHELSLGAENENSLPRELRCPIRFFGLSRNEKDGGVTAQPGDILADLQDNAILDEFAALYDRRRGLFDSTAPEKPS